LRNFKRPDLRRESRACAALAGSPKKKHTRITMFGAGNLADKAKRLGISVLDHREGGA
jgi:hypothetical protein